MKLHMCCRSFDAKLRFAVVVKQNGKYSTLAVSILNGSSEYCVLGLSSTGIRLPLYDSNGICRGFFEKKNVATKFQIFLLTKFLRLVRKMESEHSSQKKKTFHFSPALYRLGFDRVCEKCWAPSRSTMFWSLTYSERRLEENLLNFYQQAWARARARKWNR